MQWHRWHDWRVFLFAFKLLAVINTGNEWPESGHAIPKAACCEHILPLAWPSGGWILLSQMRLQTWQVILLRDLKNNSSAKQPFLFSFSTSFIFQPASWPFCFWCFPGVCGRESGGGSPVINSDNESSFHYHGHVLVFLKRKNKKSIILENQPLIPRKLSLNLKINLAWLTSNHEPSHSCHLKGQKLSI